MESSDAGGDNNTGSKVARLLCEYDLGESYGAQLEALWTADGDDRKSLRDLAHRLNKRILEHEMTTNGMAMLEGEVENVYRLLTADSVSSGMETEARARLDRNGIDVDTLEANFVSYQAIRTYLTEERGATYEGVDDRTREQNATDVINRLRERVRVVTERNLEQLRDAGGLRLGDFRLFIDIDVLCEDCNTQYGVLELIERGGCDCEEGKV